MSRSAPRGMSGFLIVSSGQFVSAIGTLMTLLALTFWAYDRTGRATELGLMFFFTYGPRLILGPIADPLADRVFEPAMRAGGALTKAFGGPVGTGPGSGLGPPILLGNLCAVAVFVAGFAFWSMRALDATVPDHDETPAVEAT